MMPDMPTDDSGLEDLVEACRENGEHWFANFLEWVDLLMDATPENVDRLLADYEATLPETWAERPKFRNFVSSIRQFAFYSGPGDAPRVATH